MQAIKEERGENETEGMGVFLDPRRVQSRGDSLPSLRKGEFREAHRPSGRKPEADCAKIVLKKTQKDRNR
jgi:hypothetical protein